MNNSVENINNIGEVVSEDNGRSDLVSEEELIADFYKCHDEIINDPEIQYERFLYRFSLVKKTEEEQIKGIMGLRGRLVTDSI